MSTTKVNGLAQTPFSEAVQVKAVPDNECLYAANVPRDWCGPIAAHGGFLQALVWSTVRTHFQTRHPTRNQPNTITAHSQFLKGILPGLVQLLVKDVSVGSRVSVVQVELSQVVPLSSSDDSKSHSKDVGTVTGLISTVTQGNLATEEGLSMVRGQTTSKDEIPDREKDCEVLVERPFTLKVVPVANKGVIMVPRGSVNGTCSDRQGRAFRDIWMSFKDGTSWDVLSLAYLVDAFAPTPNLSAENDVDFKSGISYPTLSVTTEIKKDPKNSRWLLVRYRAREIKNGRFDQEVIVIDESGDLVCVCNHVALVFAKKKTPEDFKKIYKL